VPFNYGGRAEILRAAGAFEGTTEEEFRNGLYAPEMHDPELLIRTGGNHRLSNYLMWQSVESELVFTDELWPDFSRKSFEAAIDGFRRRVERAGESRARSEGQPARESRETLSGH
jgi:undecaprenyl diphosphate synthase